MRIISCCLAMIGAVSIAFGQTTAERLGYPKNTKLLIIHADDIGVSHSENVATIQALEKGSVNSGSIMIPCPWMPEIATYAKAHPSVDLGLHLTLTAEWKYYRWGPVASKNEVPSLLDAQGYLPDNTEALAKGAKAAEVEKELRAQIERAKQFGIDPTHFDTHMAGVLTSIEAARAYVKLGHEYRVPVLMHEFIAKAMLQTTLQDLGVTSKDVVADQIIMANPPDYQAGMKAYYTKALTDLPAGLNVLLLHAAHDDDEMRAVTIDHPDYGAAWRQADFDFFTSAECKKLLKDNGIQLVTWREIRDKIVRKN